MVIPTAAPPHDTYTPADSPCLPVLQPASWRSPGVPAVTCLQAAHSSTGSTRLTPISLMAVHTTPAIATFITPLPSAANKRHMTDPS
jgi:hypothetical protein